MKGPAELSRAGFQEASAEMPLWLFALVCFAGLEFGYGLSTAVGREQLPIIWAPLGVLTASLVVAGRHHWTRLLLTAAAVTLFAGAFLHGRSQMLGAAFCVIYSLEAVAAARLLQRNIDGPFSLARVAHVGVLAAVAALVPVAGALAAALLLHYSTGHASLLPTWRAWWLADALGILLAAPLAFAWMAGNTAFAGGRRPWRLLEVGLVMIGAIVATEMVFGDSLPLVVRVPSYILPLLLWAAFRCEIGDTMAVMFTVCALAAWNTAHARGPFAALDVSASANGWVLRSQGGIAAINLSILLLASVVAERKRTASERAALLSDLQQALIEIKTLRGMIPICAWCHKVRDDAGFWQGIEGYLHAHTDATFSHGICPECTRRVDLQAETSAPASTSVS